MGLVRDANEVAPLLLGHLGGAHSPEGVDDVAALGGGAVGVVVVGDGGVNLIGIVSMVWISSDLLEKTYDTGQILAVLGIWGGHFRFVCNV